MSDPTWLCGKYSCAKEEQCDDCWMVDHLKECKGCTHYDHPVENKEVHPIFKDILNNI